jgi:RimJ/RimL family protein N-acetyltransferase
MKRAARIGLRLAEQKDAERLLAWRNDPQTRRWYGNSSRVTPATHRAWLSARLHDPRCRLYIVTDGRGRAVGQLRLQAIRARAEVSFSVVPAARGKGVGTEVLRKAGVVARRQLNARGIFGRVQPENIGSTIAFLRAGYAFVGLERIGGRVMYRLERSLG